MTTTINIRVRDLFTLPERVGRMDFTVKLTEGVAQPDTTIGTYVITPQIVDAFDRALGLIDRAMAKGQSEATYLHGSFGSGKSHFMAMLSLLLADHEQAWRLAALHPLRTKYPWVGQKQILELHVHMLGQPDLATPIFTAYLGHLRSAHPDAPLPGLFADERLFDDAAKLLATLGEDRFFAPINALVPTETSSDNLAADWAEDGAAVWTRPRFDAARRSADPAARGELLTALVRTHFSAFAGATHSFVDIDAGLGILSRHAKSLGYDAVTVFLDEIMLWLSLEASRKGKLGLAVQHMVKLVEATDNRRPAPLVCFLARQRKLSELVGDELAGPEIARIEHALDHSVGRFGQITLEDANLPAIVEKRLLKPTGDTAREQLDATFRGLQAQAQQRGSFHTLLGTNHTTDDFRRIYPFSPVLIDALVGISSSLQRQRTALKLLTELLIEHIEDLSLGELVGVGDLFDVVAEGEKTTEGALDRRFELARQLYKHELLPLIQEANKTTTPELCQRLRDTHPIRLGCSNCPQSACRNDNRIIKTIVIAALVPGIAAFKNLTVKRLVELNHGHLASKIPGRDPTIVVGKLRRWQSQVGQLIIGDQLDPEVSIRLEGVDIRPILEQAREVDSAPRRQRALCNLLFEAMGVEDEVQGELPRKQEWRGTKRPGHIRFGNVRAMSPDQLRCPEGHDWRLVIDYPFDDPGFSPHDDERTLQSFIGQSIGTWTLVWLPSFFSDKTNRELGALVRIQHILSSKEITQKYVGHLTVDQQQLATTTLETLRDTKERQLREVIAKAYGLADARESDDDLDATRRIEQHLHPLRPGVTLKITAAGTLAAALDTYIGALLDERYPRHPRFDRPLSAQRIEQVLGRFREIAESPDKKVTLDRKELDDLRGILGELGLVRTTEATAHLLPDGKLQEIEQTRKQKAIDHPNASQVRAWYDRDDQIGLQPEAEAIVVRAYALAESRALMRGDKPYTPQAGKPIPDDVVLEKPELPTYSEWGAALDLAGHVLGVSLPGRALGGDHLKRFEDELGKKLTVVLEAALRLPSQLTLWATELGLATTTDRLGTATAVAALLTALQGQPGLAQVRILAGFLVAGQPHASVSAQALGRSTGSAAKTGTMLADTLALGVFRQLTPARERSPDAVRILDELAAILRQDELQRSLAERFRQLATEGQRIVEQLHAAPVAPVPPRPTVTTGHGHGRGHFFTLQGVEVVEVDGAVQQARTIEIGDRKAVNTLLEALRNGGEATRAAYDALVTLCSLVKPDSDNLCLRVTLELTGRPK